MTDRTDNRTDGVKKMRLDVFTDSVTFIITGFCLFFVLDNL